MQVPNVSGLPAAQAASLSLRQLLDYSNSALLTCVLGEEESPSPFPLQAPVSAQIWASCLLLILSSSTCLWAEKSHELEINWLFSILRVGMSLSRLRESKTSDEEPHLYVICSQ